MHSLERPFILKTDILSPKDGAVPVVRLFPITAMPIPEFLVALDEDPGLQHTDLMRVVLAEKSSESIPSPSMISPLGGRIQPHESPGNAALHQLADETLIHVSSPREPHQGEMTHDIQFSYYARVPSKDPKYQQVRETHIIAIPVTGASFFLQEPRDETGTGKNKMQKLVLVTLDELQELYITGEYTKNGSTTPVIDYIRMGETLAAIGKKQSDIRDTLMRAVFTRVESEEARFRQSMLDAVNRVRHGHRLMFHETSLTNAQTLSECTKEELETAYLAVQMRDMFADSKDKFNEVEGKGSPKAVDLLKFARFLAEVPPDKTLDLLLSVPTKETYRVTRFLKKSLIESLREVLPDGETLFQDASWYGSLERAWQYLLSFPAIEQGELIRAWDKTFMQHLSKEFHIPKHVLARAHQLAHEYDEYMTESSEELGPQFQQHRTMNEVTNASLLSLLMLGLGFPMNIDPTTIPKRNESVRMMRFEAYRTLATAATAIRALEIEYHTDVVTIESLINTFLEFPPKEVIVDLGTSESIFHRVLRRKTKNIVFNGEQVNLLHDERSKKDPLSIIRKLTAADTLEDEFSTNLILEAAPFSLTANPMEYFTCLKQTLAAFQEHCRSAAATSGWSVVFKPTGDPDAAEKKVRHYLSLPNEEARQAYIQSLRKGKRPGSIGELILRSKYIVLLQGPKGQEFKVEMNFYPYQRVGAIPGISTSGFLGFEEKLADDRSYKGKRILARDTTHPERPSAYELRYPPEIYGYLAPNMKRHQFEEQ